VERKRPDEDTNDRKAARLQKKTYAPPVLTEYGSVAKLTQSGAGSIADGSFSQLRTCL
jgi:hypothetical protein